MQKIIRFSGSISGCYGVTIYSETPPVSGESKRHPTLLSITNLLNLACAHSALARQAGSPHTTALVSSQGSSSSHQPLTPQERTAAHLFTSVYFFIREKNVDFRGCLKNNYVEQSHLFSLGLLLMKTLKFYLHVPKHRPCRIW